MLPAGRFPRRGGVQLIVRILQISSARTFGGGERHLADLALALQARGHTVAAALAPASPLLEEMSALPPEHLFTLPLRNALDIDSALRLAHFIREKRIEIVHAHRARDYTLAAMAVARAARARHLPRARFVVTRHVLFPLGRIHTLTLRRVARVIAVSAEVGRALGGQRLFSEDKLRIVPNGVDVNRFECVLRNFDRDAYRRTLPARAPLLVGTIGELSEVKGQADFVRAASLVVRHSRVPVDFLIIGADSSKTKRNRAALESLIAAENLEARVHLLGHRADVAQLLAALDLFVSTSRSEAFGLAMVEAMACGVPIIATATRGACTIVDDGVTGRLVPIGDEAALAKAILTVLEDTRQRALFGKRAREQARALWSLERMVDETERIYEDALQLER